MRIALFEPDNPQNTGTIFRLAACLGHEAHIIEPAGFATSDRAFRRARLILLTTRAHRSYLAHAFRRGDVLLFGRETSGVPEKVHAAADARLVIPMREGLRSLNVAMAAAMAVGEAMRQTAAPSRGES